MKLSKIQELLQMVAESGLAEVEVEDDDFKITIRQNAPTVMMQPSQPSYTPPPAYPPYGGAPQHAAPQPPAPQQAAQQPHAAPSQPQAPAASGSASASTQAPPATDDSAEDADDGELGANEVLVKAPIVGTFYRAPSPDSDPFVEEGDAVSDGDVLCIIEAMKLMNEIECETPGIIKEILVEDAEPVEFDQPLFIVDQS